MKKLVKNRVNIFDKIAVGISLIPFLTFCTLFTYCFSENLNVAGGSDTFSEILNLTHYFFDSISMFHVFVLALLFLYQIWFVVNVFITKDDKRKKKKTHDFGLFILSCSLWVAVLAGAFVLIVAVWDAELLLAYLMSAYVEFQPMATLFVLVLLFALINIVNNLRYILFDGVKKYLKDCESCDYKFTNFEMLVGAIKLIVVLLLVVIVTYQMCLSLLLV